MINLQSLRRHFSSSPFYSVEALTKVKNAPQQYLLSQYVSQPISHLAPKLPNFTHQNSSPLNDKFSYQRSISEKPHGSATTLNYKNVELTLLSFNYDRVSPSTLHKALFKAKPEIVIVQQEAQILGSAFMKLPKDNNLFSDWKYLKQLYYQPTIPPNIQAAVRGRTQTNSSQRSQHSTDGMRDSLAIAGLYGKDFNVPLLVGGIPKDAHREWVSNINSMMELRELFKNVCRELPKYKALNIPISRLAPMLFPSVFLPSKDLYTQTLIEMVIGTRKYRRITALCGVAQGEAISYYFSRNPTSTKPKPIIEVLIAPPPQADIIRNPEPLELIEKHVLLDVLEHGKQIMKVPVRELKTTLRVMKQYGSEYPDEILLQFQFDKTRQYLELYQAKYAQGEQEKLRVQVSEALKSF